MKINPSNHLWKSLAFLGYRFHLSPEFPSMWSALQDDSLWWRFSGFPDTYYLPWQWGKLRFPKHPKAFQWSIGRHCTGVQGLPSAFCVLLWSWVLKASFPVVCLHWLLSWFLLFRFPLGPPVFPLNHRKWGDLGLSQCVTINYLTAVWKRSLRYLLGAAESANMPNVTAAFLHLLPSASSPAPTYQNFPSVSLVRHYGELVPPCSLRLASVRASNQSCFCLWPVPCCDSQG